MQAKDIVEKRPVTPRVVSCYVVDKEEADERDIVEYNAEATALGVQADVLLRMADDIRTAEEDIEKAMLDLKKRQDHYDERTKFFNSYANDPKKWCSEIQKKNLAEARNILYDKLTEVFESDIAEVDVFPGQMKRSGDSGDAYGSFSYDVSWGTLKAELPAILDFMNRHNKFKRSNIFSAIR